ncbi:MAG: inositol monophosphatase family protein [Desulfomonilia bacterium]
MKLSALTSDAMIDFAIQTAKKAGEVIRNGMGKAVDVQHKGRIDLVTQIDRGSQRIIVEEIGRAFPTHSILAEEGGSKQTGSRMRWIIDPLDGTVNFVHGIPIFCVSIALYRSEEPILGVCFNPITNEVYWAQEGRGAYCDEQRLSVSNTEHLIDSLVATGFPYTQQNIDVLTKRFLMVLSRVQGVRRLGSAALDLCYVASGAFDAFWEEGLNPWDMAAGVLILAEARGRISSLDGSPYHLAHGDILASNGRVHDELSSLM